MSHVSEGGTGGTRWDGTGYLPPYQVEMGQGLYRDLSHLSFHVISN